MKKLEKDTEEAAKEREEEEEEEEEEESEEDESEDEEEQPPGHFPSETPDKKGKGKQEPEKPEEPDKPKKPSASPGETSMAPEASGKFKPPKPRIYSGKGKDTKEHVFRQWRTEVTDYMKLMNVPTDQQVITLGYFVSDTAKDYYQTKREDNEAITIKEMLDGLKKHVVPSTQGNNYWNEWNAIKQIEGNRTKRIGLVAIDIERVARCIAEGKQGQIGEGVKLQKLLDAMHPDLRFQVEPAINKSNFDWTEVVQTAEKYDDALFQMGKYKRLGRDAESSATRPHQPQPRNQKPNQPKNFQKKQWPPRKGNEQQYQQRKKNKECYFCGKKGHIIAECRAKQFKERGGRQFSSNSTELEEDELETHSINSQTPQMIAQLWIAGKSARALLDTGTVGTNLRSSVWAEANRIYTTKLDKPCEIRMATKNSRATANYSANAEVNIGKGRRIPCEFLVVPIASYDIILGMPFMSGARVVLDTADSTATFKDHGTTIQCATVTPTITVTAATSTPEFDTIRSAITTAEETLASRIWRDHEDVRAQARILLDAATAQLQRALELPNFQEEFPTVFPDKISITLPPLREGLNHSIELDEELKYAFKNDYRRIPESRLPQMSKWLSEWQKSGIAVRGPAPYAAPIFGVPKKQQGEIRWVIEIGRAHV